MVFQYLSAETTWTQWRGNLHFRTLHNRWLGSHQQQSPIHPTITFITIQSLEIKLSYSLPVYTVDVYCNFLKKVVFKVWNLKAALLFEVLINCWACEKSIRERLHKWSSILNFINYYLSSLIYYVGSNIVIVLSCTDVQQRRVWIVLVWVTIQARLSGFHV